MYKWMRRNDRGGDAHRRRTEGAEAGAAGMSNTLKTI